MRYRFMTVVLIGILIGLSPAALAGASEKAAGIFAEGEALLAKADFAGALALFKKAARTDRKNEAYSQQYAMLRQLIALRDRIKAEKDLGQWQKTADALRSYYYDHRLHREAFPLDRERFKRNRSADSASLLAETQLALGLDSEAVEMLSSLSPEHTSARTIVLHGLALAHTGQMEKAKKVVGNLEGVTGDTSPAYYHDLARLLALTHDATGAAQALTKAFEQTPPSRLDAFKKDVKQSADFAEMTGTPAFTTALATASKVKESPCSMGPGCGKCPKKAKCGKKNP